MNSTLKFFIVLSIGVFFLSCSSDDLNIEDVTGNLESFIFTPKTDSSNAVLEFTITYNNPNNFGVRGYCVVNNRTTYNTSEGISDSANIFNDDCSQIEANSSCFHTYYYEGAFDEFTNHENIEFLSTYYVIESTF